MHRMNGHSFPLHQRLQSTAEAFEEEELDRLGIVGGARDQWPASGERRRWLYLDEAIRQTGSLTAEDREERLELFGGLQLATGARVRAVLDFKARLEAEARSAPMVAANQKGG